jgi:NAD(P)-dependent dehydrogenase (short-subunit alcohol dehydrogenase family)
MAGRLENKVALITGGLSGIGRQTAVVFAQEGASVVVFDARDTSRDDDLPGDEFVAGLGGGGVFVHGDVRNPEDADRAVEAAVDRFGALHVLVNYAGVNMFKPLDDLTVEDFDFTMAVNVRGTFLFCKRAIQQMREQPDKGVIVNVASNFAFVAAPEASVYCASKGAVATLTKGLALEVGPLGIRVNALCPGATATELNREHRSRADVREDWKRKTPLELGREEFLALPEEIARAALFLASSDSSYMTGAHLIVDGGWNAQ